MKRFALFHHFSSNKLPKAELLLSLLKKGGIGDREVKDSAGGVHSQPAVLLTLKIHAALLSQGGSTHTPGIVILVHVSYLVTSLKLSQKGASKCCFGCYYQAPDVKGHTT